MKIKFPILIFFLLAANLPSRAQIAGSYTLPGGDAMSATHLYILSDSVYVFSYFGGMDIGKWKLKSDNVLELTRADFYDEEFQVYGRQSSAIKKDSISIQFSRCEDRATAISFDDYTNQRLMFYPVFNENANCFASPIKKNIRKTNQIHLFCQPNDFYSERSFIDQVIDKKKIQTFDLPKQFNEFLIVFNKKAKSGYKTVHMILNEKGDLFQAESGRTFRRSGNIFDLQEEDKKGLQEISEALKSKENKHNDTVYDSKDDGKQAGFKKISKIKEDWRKINIDTAHPVITSLCDQPSQRRSYR